MALNYDSPLIDNTTGSPTLDSLKSGSDKINGALTEIKEEVNDLGSASLVDTGTAAGEVPLNSSLVPKSGGTFTGEITYYGGGGMSTNTSYGTQALSSNTTGGSNTATGYRALRSNTTGNYNAANGYYALNSNTTGSRNTAHGYAPLTANTTGSSNTATGYNALYFNTEGSNNTATGYQALYSNTTGGSNTANGNQALYSNTEGSTSTATGYRALFSNTTGNDNVANGYKALTNNTTGNRNTAYGYQALYENTTGFRNIANGRNSLYSNTEGSYNTATGEQALYSNTTGYSNTATGRNSLYSNTTGGSNTAYGYAALNSNTTYNNTSGFGNDAQVTASDQVQLGDSDTTTYVYGTVQDRSDLRDKADVRDTILGLDFITALRPVDYRWDLRDDYKPDAPTEPEPLKDDATEQDIQAHELALSQYENDCAEWLIAVKHENLIHDGTHKRTRYHHGVIAQEVAEVIAESGIDFGGYQDHKVSGGEDVLSIGYDELIGPLIKALQEVNQKFDALKEEFDDYVETHS